MKYNYMSRTTDSDTSLFTPIDWDVLYSACKSLTQVRSLRLLHLVRHCARLVLRGHLTVTSQEVMSPDLGSYELGYRFIQSVTD
jgi:hypothetical protein